MKLYDIYDTLFTIIIRILIEIIWKINWIRFNMRDIFVMLNEPINKVNIKGFSYLTSKIA